MKRASKYVSMILAFGFIMMFATGCVSVSFNGTSRYGRKTVEGKGDIITRDYEVESYTGIDISANLKVVFHNSPSCSVEYKGHENLENLLTVKVQNDILYVSSEGNNFIYKDDKPAEIHIYTPELNNINLEGITPIVCEDTILGKNMIMKADGMLTGNFDIKCDSINVRIEGNVDITFTGSAENSFYDLSGMGSIKALSFETKNCDISISGKGDIKVNASESLNVNINGNGDVEYTGKPDISQRINGLGSVNKFED